MSDFGCVICGNGCIECCHMGWNTAQVGTELARLAASKAAAAVLVNPTSGAWPPGKLDAIQVRSAQAEARVRELTWDKRFMDMAALVATWSKDPSTKCGAVIVDGHRVVRGMGYNGFPRGVGDGVERYEERAVKYKLVVHAEANALLNSGVAVRGCTLYATKWPCSDCSKLIAQSSVAEVVCPAVGTSASDERWKEDNQFARLILRESGVLVYEVTI